MPVDKPWESIMSRLIKQPDAGESATHRAYDTGLPPIPAA